MEKRIKGFIFMAAITAIGLIFHYLSLFYFTGSGQLLVSGVITLVLAIFVIGGIAVYIERSVYRPIRIISRNMDEMSKGQTDVDISSGLEKTDDEVGRMIEAFQRMSSSLKMAMKLTSPELKKENQQLQYLIDQKNRTQKALEESERKFKGLLESAPDAMIIFDGDGKIVLVNGQTEKIFGYSRTELMGQKIEVLIPKGVSPGITLDTWARKRNGEQFPAEVISGQMGSGNLITAVVRNKTPQLESQRALRESEDKYKTLFEGSPLMLFVVGDNGRTISVNKQAITQLGYSEKELIGKPVLNIFHPEDRIKVEENVRNALELPNKFHNWQARKVKKDGSVMWVNENVSILESEGRRIIYVICEDITDRMPAKAAKKKE